MRLTSEELQELTKYLVSALTRNKFSVKTNRYGNILFIDKSGIRCCPAICNSLEDGKQGYAYLQLTINPYSEKDLGSYYKPRTNKSTHKTFDTNDSIDKYSGKDIHIDKHNYEQVIKDFVKDLKKDYNRALSKTEDLELDSDIIDSSIGFCRQNKDSWYISKDNYSLKTELNDLFPVPEDEFDSYWLVCFEDNSFDDEYFHGVIDLFDRQGPISLYTCPDSGIFTCKAIQHNQDKCDEIKNVIKKWMETHQSQLKESLVKIKGTGTVFDGMTGTISEDNGDKITVMVDFNEEHKVKNIFRKEQLEILED